MEKQRENTAAPTNLEIKEIKSFLLDKGNEFETIDISTEEGATYMLKDKSNNGAKVTYKFHDEGVGFKDVFDKIITNSDHHSRLYFASDKQTKISVKRLS